MIDVLLLRYQDSRQGDTLAALVRTDDLTWSVLSSHRWTGDDERVLIESAPNDEHTETRYLRIDGPALGNFAETWWLRATRVTPGIDL